MSIRNKKKRKIQKVPDESFQQGSMSVERFGKNIVLHNRNTPTQQEKMTRRMAESLPKVTHELDCLVAQIVARIHRHDPLELLRFSYHAFGATSIGKSSESDYSADDSSKIWTLEYIFNVIASSSPPRRETVSARDADYEAIRQDVQDLITKAGLPYMAAASAQKQASGVIMDRDYEALHVLCQMHHSVVRKTRYPQHDIRFLEEFLTPHHEIFKQLFGFEVADFVNAIKSITHALSHGMFDALLEVHKAHQAYKEYVEKNAIQVTSREQFLEIVKHLGHDKKLEACGGSICQDDLFDVQKNTSLPSDFLDRLSWNPGEDTEFLAPGDFCGWPLRMPPIKKRPFLKLNGRYFCHLSYGLVDNIYRIIQKIIFAECPGYKTTWKDKQAAASESLPVQIFSKLFPGSKTYQSIFYQWPPTESKSKNWCEADAAILYDDHLIILEVKAGSFAPTSPLDDFDAHVRSVRDLIQKPADQAHRFIEYLSSRPDAPIFVQNPDGEKVEIGCISAQKMRCITPCGITLENFSHLAAQASELQSVGASFHGKPFWSLAIDDLMVCGDIFPSPTIFAHYLEKRMLAATTPSFNVIDEMEHLGLYFQYSDYSSKVKDHPDISIHWNGHGKVVDDYFNAHSLGQSSAVLPKQEIPLRMQEMISVLDKGGKSGHCYVGSFLLNFNKESREDICDGIEKTLISQTKNGRIFPLSLNSEADASLSVFCWMPGITWDPTAALEYATQSLAISEKERHLALHLFFDAAGSLQNMDWTFLAKSSFSQGQWAALGLEAISLRQSRVAREIRRRDGAGIGNNESCPCGSGVRYKGCCKSLRTGTQN